MRGNSTQGLDYKGEKQPCIGESEEMLLPALSWEFTYLHGGPVPWELKPGGIAATIEMPEEGEEKGRNTRLLPSCHPPIFPHHSLLAISIQKLRVQRS